MDELQLVSKNKREAIFIEDWLPEIIDKIFNNVYKRENGSYSFEFNDYGIIDFYPKANNLLIRKTNTWKKPGLKWIKENILK
jgi:hypothetical protein